MNPSPYDSVHLNDEEIKEAIRQAKIKKYFHELHKDYWIEKEAKKKKDGHVTNL